MLGPTLQPAPAPRTQVVAEEEEEGEGQADTAGGQVECAQEDVAPAHPAVGGQDDCGQRGGGGANAEQSRLARQWRARAGATGLLGLP